MNPRPEVDFQVAFVLQQTTVLNRYRRLERIRRTAKSTPNNAIETTKVAVAKRSSNDRHLPCAQKKSWGRRMIRMG
jgi:hypothetical protein